MSTPLKHSIDNYATVLSHPKITQTDFELAKLQVADAYLAAIGLPTTIPKDRLSCELPDGEKESTIGWIYLGIDLVTDLKKIGWSGHPKAREREIKRHFPMFRIVAQWKGTMKHERRLHDHFAAYRCHGEWFNITGTQCATIETQIANMES